MNTVLGIILLASIAFTIVYLVLLTIGTAMLVYEEIHNHIKRRSKL